MNTNLYETIFKRKSVRKYNPTPLADDVLQDFLAYIESRTPIFEGIKVEFKLVPGSMIKNFLMPIKAPHYLLVFSENKEGYLTNAGYLLQQLDLYFSANGIGSCWVGMAKPSKELVASSTLHFVIGMAFGTPQDALHRQSEDEFKRKSLEKITNIEGMEEVFEAVRLAPSATNSQPWYFTASEGYIHAYCVKPGFIKAMFYAEMNKIDIGIAISHLQLATGKGIKVMENENGRNNPPAGYYYITSLQLESLS